MKVLIVANDVVPGMGLPVAAPGIRAWGMADGLRAHGHDVHVVVDPWMVDQIWKRPLPPPLPPHTRLLPPRQVPAFARAHGVEAVVMCNSNHADALTQVDCPLVYDLFAPKALELEQNTARTDLAEAVQRLEERKLRAFRRCDAVIVNGRKKLPYARSWLRRSGAPEKPVEVVNPGLAPRAPAPEPDGRLHVIVSGYLQPWSKPGRWAEALQPLLDDDRLRLHLLVGQHWGQRDTVERVPDTLMALAQHPHVVRHPVLRFGDFRTLMSRCHVSLDVFARNPERELAMVTRSVVALSCGVPVMHVPFTEVSPFVREFEAGWLVDEDDVTDMTDIFGRLLETGTDEARAGAVAVSHQVLDPAVASAPLDDLLRRWA